MRLFGHKVADEQLEEKRWAKPLEPGSRGNRVEAKRDCAQIESSCYRALEVNGNGEHGSGGKDQSKDEREVLGHADACAVIPPLRGLCGVGNCATVRSNLRKPPTTRRGAGALWYIRSTARPPPNREPTRVFLAGVPPGLIRRSQRPNSPGRRAGRSGCCAIREL
jgi:hypothetical protein